MKIYFAGNTALESRERNLYRLMAEGGGNRLLSYFYIVEKLRIQFDVAKEIKQNENSGNISKYRRRS